MAKINPEEMQEIEQGGGIEIKTNQHGQTIGWKGRYLPDYFDNYTECLRLNQDARRVQLLAAEGKNDQGQTKEQQKAFTERQKIQKIRKEKAEDALLASQNFSKGG